MEIGKANYEGSNKKNRFKIKDGNNVYRILPPIGSLAKKGHWSKYWSVVWGYQNANGKNRPFADCRIVNFNTKMVEVESDAYLRSQKFKKTFEDLKAKLKGGEKVDPKLLEKAEQLKDRYNIEGKHYVNVVNLQGEIGLLKLGSRAKKLLEAEIKKLTAKGVDPLSLDNGRFFNIFREGRGNDTVYQVTEYKETVMMNGQEVDVPKIHKMDDAFISRLSSDAFDLGNLYTIPTADQVKAIVEGADPDVVLGLRQEEAEDDADSSNEETSSGPSQQELEMQKAKKLEEETAKAEDAQRERLAAEAKKAQEEAAKQTTAEATPAGNTAAMSDEEFLKQMGLM